MAALVEDVKPVVRENSSVRLAYEAPYLRITVLKEDSPTDDEWEWNCTTIRQYHTEAEQASVRFAQLVDLRKASNWSMKTWNDFRTLVKELKPRNEKNQIAVALVTTNYVFRTTINGIIMVLGPPSPIRLVETPEEGEAFLAECIAKENAPAETVTESSESWYSGMFAGTASAAA